MIKNLKNMPSNSLTSLVYQTDLEGCAGNLCREQKRDTRGLQSSRQKHVKM